MEIIWIDSDEAGVQVLLENGFGEVADGGDGKSGTDFDDREGSGTYVVDPISEAVFLVIRTMASPASVGEHEDIGSGDAAANWADGEFAIGDEVFKVNVKGEIFGLPDFLAVFGALEVLERTVAFVDVIS